MMKNRLKEINKGLFEFDPVAKTTGGSGGAKSGGDNDGKMDVDEQEVAEEAPTKCISTPLTVDIKALIKFVDYEGRVDAESLQKIVTQINPKRLVSQMLRIKCITFSDRTALSSNKFVSFRYWCTGLRRRPTSLEHMLHRIWA